MADEFQPSEEYADFFFLALDHAIATIEEAAGPLIPFVMTVDREGRSELRRFVTERLEDGVKRAQEYIDSNQDKWDMYAIAWDGYVSIEDERTDAILVEAGYRTDPSGVIFCQRYRVGEIEEGPSRGAKCQTIGNPALIERPNTRFK